MSVVVSPEAVVDLEAAVDFLTERNPTAAARLVDRAFELFRQLDARDFEGPEQVLSDGSKVRSWTNDTRGPPIRHSTTGSAAPDRRPAGTGCAMCSPARRRRRWLSGAMILLAACVDRPPPIREEIRPVVPSPIPIGPSEVDEVLALLRAEAGPDAHLRTYVVACADVHGRLVESCPGHTWTGTEVYGRSDLPTARLASAEFERRAEVIGFSWSAGTVTRALVATKSPLGDPVGPRCAFAAVLARARERGFALEQPFHVRFWSGDARAAGSWTLSRSLEQDRVVVGDDCSP